MSLRLPLTALALLTLNVIAYAAPKATKISPAAKPLIAQMIAAENALISYSGTITMTDQGSSKPIQIDFKVKKPNQVFVITSAVGAPQSEAISDGINLALADFGQKKYTQGPAPANDQAITQTLAQSNSLLAITMASPEFLSQFFTNPSTQTLTVGPVMSLASKSVVPLTIKIAASPTVSETLVFQLGSQDHLPYNVTVTIKQPGHISTHTETLTNFQINPTLTAADFTFTPPPGLTKVASAQDMQPPMYDARLTVGADPLPIKTVDLSGKPLTLDNYKGKVVMLDFWATWCPPCRGEIPNVVAAYHKYHAQGFDIVGVSLDQPNDRGPLEKFLVQNHMTWPQVYDGGYWQSALAKQYGVQAIPFSLLIGKDGKIVAVGDSMRGPGLAPAIHAALARK
jgi:thiol-disulfide isomerase/thioredoxin